MKLTILILVGPAIFLQGFFLETEGGPVHLNAEPKPPNCPHGQCFIDRCTRICTCVSPEGTTLCTNNYLNVRSSMECAHPNVTDNCPLGQTYRSELWNDNFLCFCNDNESQTYACYDLSTRRYANPVELMRRNHSMGQEINISTGGRSSEKVMK